MRIDEIVDEFWIRQLLHRPNRPGLVEGSSSRPGTAARLRRFFAAEDSNFKKNRARQRARTA